MASILKRYANSRGRSYGNFRGSCEQRQVEGLDRMVWVFVIVVYPSD